MKPILKQSSFLILAQVLGRIIGFFYTIYLARSLGVSNFGLYSLALAYLSLFIALTDFGFSRFLVREIALNKLNRASLISNIGILRLTITSAFFGILSVFLYISDPDKVRVSLLLLTLTSVFSISLSQTLDAVFIAEKKLQYSALALLILNISTMIFGIFLVNSGFGNTGAVSALIIGYFIYLLVLFIILKNKKVNIFSDIEYSVLKKALKGSLPYGLLGILGLLYFKVDTLLLAYLRGNFETGIYSAGYKFLESIVFVPNTLSLALFPIFSNFHNSNLNEIRKLSIKSVKLMFTLGILVLIIFNIALPPIIKLFLPNYLHSIDVIRIISLAIPFMFSYVPLSTVFLSTDKYLRQVILLSILPLLFNIVLNLLFIPKYGYLGASWVTVLSDVVSFMVTFGFIRKYVFR